MICGPACYLLRIDDLCPTLSRERWKMLRVMIDEFGIRPILAVVPDNHDPALEISPPDPSFWSQIRCLESTGAAIGLHGFRHLCLNEGQSMVSLHRTSEFAGVPVNTQRAWIRKGIRVLRDHGLDPRLFVPPRHGIDANTLTALRREGMPLLSDGFARAPFLRGGVIWIPQQLWAPVEKHKGVWTICIHPNTARDEEIEALRAFLRAHADQFTSIDGLLARLFPTERTFLDRLQTELSLRRVMISRKLRFIRRSSALASSNSA